MSLSQSPSLPDDDEEVPADAPVQVQEALRNIVVLLQANPQRYRCFSCWWWPIKVLLIGAGYTRDNLYYLGSYIDAETAALVPPGDLQATLKAALEAYRYNVAYPHPNEMVEGPDGELVRLWDADAGM
jgi:hypothetical protein